MYVSTHMYVSVKEAASKQPFSMVLYMFVIMVDLL
jgi:hypothetical protein